MGYTTQEHTAAEPHLRLVPVTAQLAVLPAAPADEPPAKKPAKPKKTRKTQPEPEQPVTSYASTPRRADKAKTETPFEARFGPRIKACGIAAIPGLLFRYGVLFLGMTGDEVLLCATMLDAWWGGDWPFLTNLEIAQRMGRSEHHVIDLKASLLKKRLIARRKTRKPNGYQGADRIDFSPLFAQLERSIADYDYLARSNAAANQFHPKPPALLTTYHWPNPTPSQTAPGAPSTPVQTAPGEPCQTAPGEPWNDDPIVARLHPVNTTQSYSESVNSEEGDHEFEIPQPACAGNAESWSPPAQQPANGSSSLRHDRVSTAAPADTRPCGIPHCPHLVSRHLDICPNHTVDELEDLPF
jgi:hypothetical protein